MNRDEKTAYHFDNPKVGDEFTEMCAYWFEIIDIRDSGIVIEETYGDNSQKLLTFKDKEELQKKYSYGGNTPGYWVTYLGNKVDDSKESN